MTGHAKTGKMDERAALVTMFAGAPILVAVAYGASLVLKTPFPGAFAWTLEGALIGVLATAPMCLFLIWFMRAQSNFIARFRERQIEDFAKIGFLFTPPRIAIIALGAGVSEEILFRGVLQDYAAARLPIAAAIILPNIVFGLLHARSWLYAVIAGLVGCWLGVVYWLSGNLLAPIIAHALYDVFALEVTRRAIAAHPRVDADSASSVTG